MMAQKKYNCFVPCCPNTSKKCPNKLFLTVPTNQPARLRWCKAVRRDTGKSPVSPKSHLTCCEDHFDLEQDVENWSRYTFYKDAGLSTHMRLKPNVIPHKFECQKGRRLTVARPRPSVMTKLKQKRMLNELLRMTPSTSCVVLAEEKINISTESCSTSMVNVSVDRCKSEMIFTSDRSIQVNLVVPYRSKYVQVAPSAVEQSTSPLPCPLEPQISTEMTPVKQRRLQSDCDYKETVCGSSWTETTSSLHIKAALEPEKWSKMSLIGRLTHLEGCPMAYLGVSTVGLKFLNKIAPIINCPQRDLYITLQKLRLNQSNLCLGSDFGISRAQAGRIFLETLPKLAGLMSSFIYWPKEADIHRLLPIPFRYRYKKVQSIIDFFEVPIEKPSNPEKRAHSWSDFKKVNTAKYMVSCTPSGLINYVSGGYGGRTSDTALAEHCGYLDLLKPGIHIMAERGFKGLSVSLADKGITLVRPPSIQNGSESDKTVAMQVKRIASLRMIVERVMGRIRNYRFVSNQNCVDTKQIPLLDAAVIVVAALVNLQNRLFQ